MYGISAGVTWAAAGKIVRGFFGSQRAVWGTQIFGSLVWDGMDALHTWVSSRGRFGTFGGSSRFLLASLGINTEMIYRWRFIVRRK